MRELFCFLGAGLRRAPTLHEAMQSDARCLLLLVGRRFSTVAKKKAACIYVPPYGQHGRPLSTDVEVAHNCALQVPWTRRRLVKHAVDHECALRRGQRQFCNLAARVCEVAGYSLIDTLITMVLPVC